MERAPGFTKENWKFHVGRNLARVGGGDLIWFGPLKRFQYRRVFERWCESTPWGQMFLRYAQMGPQGESFVPAGRATPIVPTSTRIH